MKVEYHSHGKQTGKTLRMLEEAVRLATEEKRYVFVFASSFAYARDLQNRVSKMTPGTVAAQKFYPDAGGQISFEVPESRDAQLDWNNMTVRGAHSSCAVLVDHYAIESRFRNTLKMLNRFDQKEEPDA